MSVSKGIYIIGAKRTPFCHYGGLLRELPASQAFAAAAKDAMHSANLDPNLVDQTVVGSIHYLSQCDGGKTPRYCGLFSGVPISQPALGVNKACGTGIQAIVTAAVDILFGISSICLTGGTEIMSTLPMLVRNVRFGTTLGASYVFEDHIKKDLVDSHLNLRLSQLAEETAKKCIIGRMAADEFTWRSHLNWKKAFENNIFDDEITKLTVSLKKKEFLIEKDELPNPKLTQDLLDMQEPSVEKGYIVTSLNSSAPADGAAAILLAGEESLSNLTPLARLAGWSCVGVDPLDTGTAAAVAIRKLLEEQKINVEDVDLFEINETFAVQVLSVIQQLQIDISKVNVNGGALAMGNPVSATGARMVTHLTYQMRKHNAKTAIAASSCGGGQGIAILLEKV